MRQPGATPRVGADKTASPARAQFLTSPRLVSPFQVKAAASAVRRDSARMNRSVLLALFLLLATAGPVLAGKQDFTLVNQTGFDIHEVYISPHAGDDWEDDVMGKAILVDGQSVAIKFARTDKTKEWDLKVVNKEGRAIVWEKLNLLEISKVTLHFKDGKAAAEVE